MTKRRMAFGVICLLVGILLGIEIAGDLDLLVRMILIVAILLLCVYLLLPYFSRRSRIRWGAAQRVPPRRTQRRP